MNGCGSSGISRLRGETSGEEWKENQYGFCHKRVGMTNDYAVPQEILIWTKPISGT